MRSLVLMQWYYLENFQRSEKKYEKLEDLSEILSTAACCETKARQC